jgi:hypothetical protein
VGSFDAKQLLAYNRGDCQLLAREMNYPAASGRGIRIKIDSIVDFGVAAGILGFSLLGMVR